MFVEKKKVYSEVSFMYLRKGGKSNEERSTEGKIKASFFIVLSDLTFVQSNNSNDVFDCVCLCMYLVCMYMYIHTYVCLYLNEMNNDIRDKRQEIRIVTIRYSHSTKWHSVI